jgi:small subunit ribosomal protein S14
MPRKSGRKLPTRIGQWKPRASESAVENGRDVLPRFPVSGWKSPGLAGKLQNLRLWACIVMGDWAISASRIMAKKSWIARNERKKRTVEKFSELRMKLIKEKDYIGLSQLPRDASPTRVVNRCAVTGRRRAFLRRFRLSRISFRELASAGMIPGVTKSSW